MPDPASKLVRVTQCPSQAEIKARLDCDGEVFLTIEKVEDNYRIVFVDPDLSGGVK